MSEQPKFSIQSFFQENIEKLEKHFPYDFRISIDESKQSIIISRIIRMMDKETQTNKNREIECLEIEPHFYNKTIFIKSILGCASSDTDIGHGKDIVKRIQDFSIEIDYRLIIEYDVSRITIHNRVFPLFIMKILTTGKSWYNSLGFYEKHYIENTECIRNFIQQKQHGTGSPPKTVQQYFMEIVNKLMILSKKPAIDLTQTDQKYIIDMHTKIINKFKALDNLCSLISKDKTSNLEYMENEPRQSGGKRRKKTSSRYKKYRKNTRKIFYKA